MIDGREYLWLTPKDHTYDGSLRPRKAETPPPQMPTGEQDLTTSLTYRLHGNSISGLLHIANETVLVVKRIHVHPDRQREGLGSRLILWLMEQYPDRLFAISAMSNNSRGLATHMIGQVPHRWAPPHLWHGDFMPIRPRPSTEKPPAP